MAEETQTPLPNLESLEVGTREVPPPPDPMAGLSDHVSEFLRRYAELTFTIVILIIVGLLFHFVPYKIAFLNIFYIPVLFGGYLLGARQAVLIAFMSTLLVFVYYIYSWIFIASASPEGMLSLWNVVYQDRETGVQILMWSGFLIGVAGAFGHINERVMSSYVYVQQLNSELQAQAGELRSLNSALQKSSKDLTRKAEELQRVSSTMDSTVARMIIQGSLREEKRTLSVLFCDLKGFTNYSHARSPEVILDELNMFYGSMEDIVEAYHGHVDKYMGDGIMCEFGAPIDNQQHCLQATLAAYRMQEKFQSGDFPWKLRVGVASGDAVVGMLGSRRRSYSALGEVVNLAKRLEELCEPGRIYIDESTAQMVKPILECSQIHSLGGRRQEDEALREKLVEVQKRLFEGPKSAELLFEIGNLHFQLHEATRALDYFHQALDLDPDNADIKVAFAEASVKRDEYEKISIRGLDQKQAVFMVQGLMNPLLDRNRFPERFYQKFQYVPSTLEITDEACHPVEAIDGAIGHSLCVAVLSYAVAEKMGVEEGLRKKIMTAGRLQDLGKSVVRQHLLNRRGGLNDQERRELESHVNESVEKARDMGYGDAEVLEIIANHHELLNGQGYPRRARGDEIPLGARITCVSDVYCALTGNRPYREAWDTRVALRELQKSAEAGKYDPDVVKAAHDLLAN